MSHAERGQRPVRIGWLRLGFPNETPEEQVHTATRRIVDHLFQDAMFEPEDLHVIGTVVEVRLSLTAVRDLKPREELSPEELEVRDLMVRTFNDFDFE